MIGAASTIITSYSCTRSFSSSTALGVLVPSLFNEVCNYGYMIRWRFRDRFIDLCRLAEKKMELSECGVTLATSLQRSSTPSCTLMTDPPHCDGKVKRRGPAETGGIDENKDRQPDSERSMVLFGPHFGKTTFRWLNSYKSVTVTFRSFIINAARNLSVSSFSIIWAVVYHV